MLDSELHSHPKDIRLILELVDSLVGGAGYLCAPGGGELAVD